MVDTEYLKRIVADYKFHTRPSNGDHSAYATIRDINRVIDQTAKLFERFIAALEAGE